MGTRFLDLADAAALIPDGAQVAIGRPAAMAMVRELIRQRRRDLRLVGVPTGGLAVELLIDAGAARSIETSGVDLGEAGFAPAFSRAVEERRLEVIDSTCPAMLMALQAGASGIPFTPVPGLLGSDLMKRRPDFGVIRDPYGGAELAYVPALAPEFAIVHGRRADGEGNTVIGTAFDDRLIIQASGMVLMTVDELRPDATQRLAPDEQLIPAAYLDVISLAPAGPGDGDAAVREYLAHARQALRA